MSILTLLQTIALVCGSQGSGSVAKQCQVSLLKCALEICSEKKCQDVETTLAKCIIKDDK